MICVLADLVAFSSFRTSRPWRVYIRTCHIGEVIGKNLKSTSTNLLRCLIGNKGYLGSHLLFCRFRSVVATELLLSPWGVDLSAIKFEHKHRNSTCRQTCLTRRIQPSPSGPIIVLVLLKKKKA